MPPGFKDRGGRLQAFARNNSTGNNGRDTNGGQAPVLDNRLEQPQPVAPVPTRQAILEDIRAPSPVNRRYTAPPRESNGFGQPPLRSPKLHPISSSNSQPRTNSNDRNGDLFSGSQLGESFMNSGLTTPQNEPAEPIELGPELARDLRKNIPSHHLPDRNRPSRPAHTGTAFVVANDGFMSVVERPPRHDVAHMDDGFRDNAANGRRKPNGFYESDQIRPSSPLRHESKLPMREVRIRRSHAGKSEAYDVDGHARSSSPTIQQSQWQTRYKTDDTRRPTTVHGRDDDVDSVAQEDEHLTPKPKKPKPVAKRVLMESSMPAIPMTQYSREKKRRRPSPEYDDMALTSMAFTDLQRQPFDFDPSKEEEKPLSTNADNLIARLDQFRHLGEKEQHGLFSAMSVDDWEASGEWFVSEFAGFVQDLTEARRNKRRIIQEFEYEAASREEAVRLKTDTIDRKLSKMKQDGQRVVEDKRL
ncbi:extracellular mutant protein 11-domain-containing protein [Ilyonectria robusta]|uniref:extracellular mutant protein 11-domain-containing protein n=1 Tax=Ilyonectria robusta TaxID=1079257 RepID=UPI001E8D6974|nr:extracellular mutant protein 11-domain-containing protein [Ilyonectria robusta]KAH8735689.1 extracellular mutant protein 11-domain-containing protein [Ilyonectria robusta]